MAITQQQIAERLLKKSFGVTETNYPLTTRGISEEAISSYSLVKPSAIWTDAETIPHTPPVLNNGEESGSIKYYDKLLLQITDAGTSVSFKSINDELKGAISTTFGFGYNYKIYSNDGNTQIFKGDWLVDAESGVITFYNPGLAESTVSSALPPRISFYKYIGRRGISTDGLLSTTGGTINGDLFVTGIISGDGSGLTNIPASGVTGLNLDRITSGSKSAIMSTSGLTVNAPLYSVSFIKSGATSNDILLGDGSTILISTLTGMTSKYADNKFLPLSGGTITGDINIIGNILQSGSTYETHVNKIFTTGDTITLRDGAVSGLNNNEYTGIIAKKYDGETDGVLIFDRDGIGRIGDMDTVNWTGTTQPIVTRDESIQMMDGNLTYWVSGETKIKTSNLNVNTIFETFVNTSGDTINGYLTASGFTGSGSGLYNIPVSAITGANFSSSGVTIGPAEDGSYSDGIFTDFTNSTPIGTAIDRFNEMFKLLAPTPPSDWNSATLNIGSTTYSARALSTASALSITTLATPTFTVSVPTNGLGEIVNGVNLTFNVNGSTQETASVYGTPTKSSGVIRYTYADPYSGQSGKAGFWTGFTSASAISTSLIASSSLKTANYVHSTKGTLSKTFYLDSPLTVSIGTISATIPSMNGHVSGVKTLTAGQTISNIAFTINNVASYFYAPSPVWRLNSGLVNGQTGDPNIIPTTYGETGNVTNASTTVLSGQYSPNLNFTIQGRNSTSTYGSNTTFTDSSYRIDTVSTESERLLSGNGLHSTSYGGVYDSSQSLISTYTSELQLLNGSYIWPTGTYAGGENYSGITTGDNIGGTQYRWATFLLGTKSSAVNNVTITIPSATIGTSWNSIKMFVKIGSSGWLDATTAQSVSAPYSDGDAALDIAGSTAYYIRKVTFGTIPRAGDVYVRIGIKSTDTSFTFKKPTMA